jgi:magnesium transporter
MLPADQLHSPVLDFASREFTVLEDSLTTGEAIEKLRRCGIRDMIVYFYVVDSDGRLSGVLPARRLLTDPADTPVREAMIPRVVAIPTRANLLEACEFFVLHKFLAFPVVDEDRHIVGVLDVSVFTSEVLDLAEKEQMDSLFQSIGFRVDEIRNASAWQSFLVRFPWLLATIAGGTACALLAGVFAPTLEQKIVLAFFLTLVLGLGESVSAQSVAVTLQSLHRSAPSMGWLLRAVRKEFFVALMLGLACGALVASVVLVWNQDPIAALSIGVSIVLSMLTACLLGVLIPSVSRALHLDPRIAAGPLTLALADICTLATYFGLATWLIQRIG